MLSFVAKNAGRSLLASTQYLLASGQHSTLKLNSNPMGGYKIRNQNALYFLTITTVGWIDIFTRQRYRDLIIENLTFCQKEKGLILCAYVIMSNHLHLIAQAKESFQLSDIIRDFKSYTAKLIINSIKEKPESRREWLLIVMSYYAKYNKNNRKFQLWQQDNHPEELYSPRFIAQKLDYLHLNPVKAGWVEKPEDYLYSSASNYKFGSGQLEVIIIDLPGCNVGYVHLGG